VLLRRVIAVLGLLVGVWWPGVAGAGDAYRLLRLDGGFLKWGAPALGTGATISYAVAVAGHDDAGARNCRKLAPLAPMLAAAKVPMSAFVRELEAALAMWEAAADLRFVPAKTLAKADILIGAQGVPRGRAFANVEFDDDRNFETHRLRQSLVCLNPASPWKVGFGGNAGAYDLRYVLAHEIGHAIGLDHPGAERGQLMSFRYDEDRRELSPGDIAGVQRLYGPRPSLAKASVKAAPSPREATTH
jgi:hypothetical protein